jgi:hypothetical protein
VWIFLIAFCLIAASLRFEFSGLRRAPQATEGGGLTATARTDPQVAPAANAANRPAGQANPGASKVLSGYGRTPTAAEQIALEFAREWVADEYLAKHYPGLGWTPSPEYLRDNGVIGLEGSAKEQVIDGELMYVASARAEIKPDHLQKMKEEARKEHMKDRQLLAARVLGGVVALLVVVAGYLRLEDVTRGYYTTLLRLTAGALITMVVAALFLVR